MSDSCQHEFTERGAVLSGTLRTRICQHCDHVEVMLDGTNEWVTIAEYLEQKCGLPPQRR